MRSRDSVRTRPSFTVVSLGKSTSFSPALDLTDQIADLGNDSLQFLAGILRQLLTLRLDLGKLRFEFRLFVLHQLRIVGSDRCSLVTVEKPDGFGIGYALGNKFSRQMFSDFVHVLRPFED